MRNLFKYSRYYSGKEPEFKEGDIFRIIVPLDAEMDGETTQGGGQDNMPKPTMILPKVLPKLPKIPPKVMWNYQLLK